MRQEKNDPERMVSERYLTGAEKLLSRDLWEEAFPEDSREFDDYYFREKLKDNRVLALISEGWDHADRAEKSDIRVESMIHRNPYRLRVRDEIWQADYLVGVATREDRRHRGYMRRLLMRMMADMRAEKMPFCFLMPADEAIYRPFGFTYIFRQPHWGLRDESAKQLVRVPVSDDGRSVDLETAAAWMETWLQKRYEMYAIRDEAYLQRLADEIASENGVLDVLFDRDEIIGIVSEWGWEEREQRLLYAKNLYRKETEAPKPAIMARIISPETFVHPIRLCQTLKENERILMLKLSDPLIPENNGLWRWTLDHEGSRLEKAGDTAAADLELSITELTTWLCGYAIPDAAMSYAGQIDVLRTIFLDEVV